MSSRRKKRAMVLAVFLLGALILSLLLPILSSMARADDGPPPTGKPPAAPSYRLVHFADSHWITGSANTSNKTQLADVAKLGRLPDLLIHGGDVSEDGSPQSYDEWAAALKAALPFTPTKYVPGNHDNRWLDPGLGQFSSRFGGQNNSFDAAGVHWVMIDSTIAAETHGHFGKETLDWLSQDLAKVGTEQPIVIFFHHPIAYTPVQFTDTDDELLAAVAPYNVRAMFTGHGHLHMAWQRNGINLFMTQASYEGGYKIIDVVNGTLQVQDRTGGQTVATHEVSLARPQAQPGSVSIQAVTQRADGNWQVTLKATGLPAGVKIYYQIDAGDWYPATPGPDGVATGPFSVSSKAAGRHRVRLWAAPTTAAFPGQAMTSQQWVDRNLGPSWSDYKNFQISGSGPAVAWRYQATAGIQAPVGAGLGLAFVADRAGRVAGVNLATGQEVWHVDTGAAVLGSPVLSGDLLGVGTGRGEVVAISARTGAVVWRYQAPAPILAAPLWAGGRLIISDAGGKIYGLDRTTGALVWQYKAGAAIRAGAAYGAGSIFVGSWDGSVYALDVFSGQLQWKTTLPGALYYAPANQAPLYYKGRVFVTRAKPPGGQSLFALDARDGATLWSVAGGFGYSAAVIHDGLVAVGSGSGEVFGYDPMTGTQQYLAKGGVDTFDGALSSVGTSLVLSGLNGSVVSFAAGGGKAAVEWRFSTGEAYNYARPTAAGGLVLVGTMDGSLWALRGSGKAPAPLTMGSPGDDLPPVVGQAFPDLAGHPDGTWISLGKKMGIANGFPDGRFHPGESLTRAQQATILARYLGLSAPAKTFVSKFGDIKGHWAAADIAALEEKGLLTGVKGADGKFYFQPDRPVTRAEVAALQTRILGRSAPTSGTATAFVDITGHWGEPQVRRLEELGLVSGTAQPDGSRLFGPDAPATRAEATALLVRGAIGR